MTLLELQKALVDSSNLELAANALHRIASLPNKTTGQVKYMTSSWDIGARFHTDKSMIKSFGYAFEQPLNIFAENILNTGKDNLPLGNVKLTVKPRYSYVLDAEGNKSVDEEGNFITIQDGYNFIFSNDLKLDTIEIDELSSIAI